MTVFMFGEITVPIMQSSRSNGYPHEDADDVHKDVDKGPEIGRNEGLR